MVRKLVLGLALMAGLEFAAPAALLFNTNAPNWKYFKGRSEASTPDTAAWRQLSFDDATFTTAPAPFWYGDVLPGGTQITDMLNQYSCIFMRRSFQVENVPDVSGLRLGFRCDDGFIAWINGVEVYRYNVPAGARAYNTFAGPAVTEPVPFTQVDLAGATNYLVEGSNMIAVQAFNTSLGSTDLIIDLSLTSLAPDFVAPTVASKTPAPGVTNSLAQITVVFSEPVGGVNTSDLLINGTPAASMSGGNDTYTFNFNQPPYGIVNISWAANHGIVDFGLPQANAFNATGPGATWSYNLVDNIPPTLLYQLPFAGVTVRTLTQIQAVFSEPVSGVHAADLLINGSPAANVSTLNSSNYLFTFPQPPPGPVTVQFAAGHGIQDLASTPNNFGGGNWSYTLDPNAPVASVRINEIMAANITGLRDENNEVQDWIELYNTSSSAVSLAGWSLTDDEDEPERWVFPPVSIPGNGYLVVFCSGKDRKVVGGSARLHTNFRLSPDGEYLALYNAEVPRQAVSVYAPYPNQRRDISYGYDPVDQLKYFQTSTPGAINPASSITGIVADTKFSHDRGFYDTAFSLSITCATPSVTIRYTVDGTAPSNNVGTIYSGPINISRTTVLRAAAFKTGMLPSDTDCHTYLFLADVITQTENVTPPGWPATWGANRVDYGMDAAVVNANSGTIKDDLKAVPTVSVVMRLDDMFGSSQGIYANPGGDTIAWERPCSLEMIYPDDTQGFQINCGIRIRGGYSRSQDNAKHAVRFFFRQEYGATKLVYPVFGPTGADEFDKFDMRTMQNYSWSYHGDPNMICLRDVMSRDAQLAMGQPATRGNFYHLYINGQYWGMYNSEERPEAAFAESYVGGAADNYDVVKVLDGYNTGVTDGNMAAWTRLWQAATNGFANDEDYYKVQGLNVDGTPNLAYENLLDVDNLIDYMFIILYGGNLDAPISNFLSNNSPNNWYGFRDRSGTNGGFRFVSHDAEHTLLDVNADRTGPYAAGDPTIQGAATGLQKSQPQYIWTRLQQNAEFRMRVADRLQKHCFNRGPLSVEGIRSMYLARSNEIQRAIVAESARWGNARVSPARGRSDWVNAIMSVYNGFLGGRTAVFLSQMRTDNMWPTVTAPIFSSSGGVVSNGFRLFMTNNNAGSTIYYTVNGIDPRSRGGAVAATAIAYTPGTPVIINFPTIVRARVRSGTTWGPITEATFYTPQDFGKLIITEIMYNPVPAGSDDFEFIEFKNAGTNILDFTAVGFDAGVTFAFTNNTRIGPGQFFVLGRNRPNLQVRYPGLTVHGVYSGRLDNGGEVLALTNNLGARVFSVEYKDGGRWPRTPDGYGFSLVTRDPNANPNPNNPSSWRASTNPGGSPGADDPAPTIPGILINEALTHTDPPNVDAIELYNPTVAAVNIGGWFLTDDGAAPTKFRIPNGTIIGAGEYLVFDESHFNPTPGTNNSFALDSGGDQIYIFSGDVNTNLTGYSHGYDFDAAPNGVSFGRHVLSTGDDHFVLQRAVTLGAANAGPLVGPVVIRQIMYHPPDLAGDLDNSADEYVEIRNITLNSVALYDSLVPTNTWHVRGGIDYDFPQSVTIGATQSLVLVNFDPNDTVARNAFLGKYGAFSGVPLFGPYSGKLDNSSDTIRLERPDPPDTNGVPYIWVDQVDYRDAAPWPSGPDGSGSALQRVDLAAYAGDPANWVGAAPLTISSIEPLYTQVKTGTNAVVTITVSAFGTGELSYQWYLNGGSLPGETNESITIADVQFADDGFYTVRVSDLSGSALSPAAALRVVVTPAFVQLPVSQTVVAGGRVTLSGAYIGHPPPFTNEWRQSSPPFTNTAITSGHSSFYTFIAPTNPVTLQYRLVIKSSSTPGIGVSHSVISVVVLADTDLDGIPDNWENPNGLDPNLAGDATIDSDGDTMTNLEEYIAGTNPQDPTSYLQVRELSAGNSATISFQAISNKTYSVEYTDNLSSPTWNKLADVVAAGTNRTATVIDPAPSDTRFYRLGTPRQP